MKNNKPREFWVCHSGMDFRNTDDKYWVSTRKPSGISGGGNNQATHVVEYSAYEQALARIVELESQIIKWHEGYPDRKYFEDEWFIAKTINGDRVVLKSLPEDYSYDFKTADETYIKKENIKAWSTFPDSQWKQDAFDKALEDTK